MIKLKDAKWAIAVEQCLKRLIEAFACHDGHDMMLLKSIFKKYRSNKERTPLIIVSSFSVKLEYWNSRFFTEEYLALIQTFMIKTFCENR